MTGAWVGMTGGRAAHARGASNPSDRTQPKIRRSSAVERSSGTDLQTLICQWLLSGAAIFSRPDLHQNSKTTIFRVLRRSKGLLAINNLSVSSQRYNARARARVFVSQQFAWSEGVGPTNPWVATRAPHGRLRKSYCGGSTCNLASWPSSPSWPPAHSLASPAKS